MLPELLGSRSSCEVSKAICSHPRKKPSDFAHTVSTSTDCRHHNFHQRRLNPHPCPPPLQRSCQLSRLLIYTRKPRYLWTHPLTSSPHSRPILGPLGVPHLAEALSLLPARKATPPHLAQLHLWHLGKEVLLPHLAALCQQLWQSPHDFHQLWADAWIAWLAKPGKAPDQPENLRPISLTEGGGRIVVKALTLQLRPSLTEATQSWPQYAYVPGRSIEHAIIRALHHCDRVHTAIASQRVTLQERRTTGRVPTACRGGVTLSIDMSKAFDTVDRSVLEHELKTARIPEPELTLIMSPSGIGRPAPSQMSESLAREA